MAAGLIFCGILMGGLLAFLSLFSGGSWSTAAGLYVLGGGGAVLTLATVLALSSPEDE